jgi:hypothetical protein
MPEMGCDGLALYEPSGLRDQRFAFCVRGFGPKSDSRKSQTELGRRMGGVKVDGLSVMRQSADMSRTFLRFLVAEFVVIAAVVMIFRIIETRLMAGAVAGTVFVMLGLYIFISGLKEIRIRRSATFVMACVHLFLVALPLMITRALNATIQFEEVRIWGVPGPVFHQLSTVVYWLMILATVFDWYRFKRLEKRKAQTA